MRRATGLKDIKKDESGSIAVIFAIGILLIILAAGVAIDIARLESTKTSAQDFTDNAVLAAARTMTASENSSQSIGERKKEAKQVAQEIFDAYIATGDYEATNLEISFPGNAEVRAVATLKVKPYLMHIFRYNKLDVQVDSGANIGQAQATDIDIALVSDATASMSNTLFAIQQNMQSFTSDLSMVLQSRNIKAGAVRVKFIFYRDYMIDNHMLWTGPDMAPDASIPGWGPMYTSSFFELPSEKVSMDAYVDSFIAEGGGSVRESGLEAIWYAVNDANWKSGADSVRAVVLWTDAPTRPFGDTQETSLEPGDLFWEPVLPVNVGDEITTMTRTQREQFMFDAYYPKDAPSSLGELKTLYENFHNENANGFEGVKTMTVNILNNCLNLSPCGDWPNIATWEGVDYRFHTDANTISETYDKIVLQVADMVQKQLIAKDLVIQY